MTSQLYFSVKTKDPVTVHKILNKESDIEMSGLNILENALKIGQLVFVVLGGDKPEWDTGLIGLGVISKEPYDKGYDNSNKRNYKINIDMKIILQKAIKRKDLIPYSETYGTIGIAPITNWEPNQALSQIPDEKAIALLRAMIELDGTIQSELSTIVGSEIMKKVTDLTLKSVQIPTYFGETEQQALERYLREIKKHSTDNSQQLSGIQSNHVQSTNFMSWLQNSLSRNQIVFGAPGTGKSFKINEDRKKLLGLRADEDYERVTFHPDYSYANFVGTYKPVMKPNNNQSNLDPDTSFILSVLEDKTLTDQQKYDQLYGTFNNNQQLTNLPILMGLICGTEKINTRMADGSASADNNQIEFQEGKTLSKFIKPANMHEPNSSGGISYEYVPGPFMRMYVKAMKNVQDVTNEFDDPRPFLLIIEEINRANVAAVFGEIFQLLDRNDDNVSEYPIQTSEDIRNYLAKELGGNPSDYAQIRIPDNMFIWATMNSADQGVFPMDTAFKRRWDFTYLGIDDNDSDIQGKVVKIKVGNTEKDIEWNSLRQAINEFLASEKINEDKQLGPYFISRKITVPANGGNIIDTNEFNRVFKQKVIPYIFDDAAKQKRSKIFEGIPNEANRYSKICDAYDKIGIGIFAQSIQNYACNKSLKYSTPAGNTAGTANTATFAYNILNNYL